MTAAPTTVVFRRCKTTGQVVALFPYVRKGYGLCNSFSHAGGHATVEFSQVLRETTAASALTQQDVRRLLQELVTTPHQYQLKVAAAEEIVIEREAPGEQMSLFVLPAPMAITPGPRRSPRLARQVAYQSAVGIA